jgi:cation transporter-like permease
MKKNIQRGLAMAGVVAASALASTQASAAGPDMTGLTSAVDFSTVITAVMAIAGLLAVVYVAIKGARIGLSMIKR